MKFRLSFFSLLLASMAFGQGLNERFILISEFTTSTVLTGDTWRTSVRFPTAQLGAWLPTGITVGHEVVDGNGRRYEVIAIQDATFSTAIIDVEEKEDLNLAPQLVGIIYAPNTNNDLILVGQTGSNGISPVLLAKILNHLIIELDNATGTAQGLAFSGTGPFTLDISGSTSDVTFTEGNGIDITGTSTDLTFKLSQQGATSGQVLKWNGSAWVPDSDNTGAAGSTDLSFSGSSGTITLLSSSGTDVSFAPGTNMTFSQSGGTLTMNATEVDGSISNEGSLTVGTGTATTSIINSNTSGSTGVTLTAAGALSISESGNVITLTATEVDGSTSNELQNLSYTAATGALTISGGTGATIPVMVGANGTVAGTRGLVPDPTATDNVKFLRGDGTWQTISTGMTSFTWGDGASTTTITTGETIQVRPGDGLASALSGNDVYLSLASQGATTGQVLKWNGSTWAPGTDNSGSGVTSVGITTSESNAVAVTNSPITSTGNINLNFDNDLEAIAGFSTGTGFPARASEGTWVLRSVAGSTSIAVTNGDGVSGNPTISLASQSASAGQVLKWSGSAWVPDTDNTGGAGSTDLSFSGATSPVSLLSSSGTDVIFAAGTNVTLSQSGGTLTINSTGGTTDLTFSGASSPYTLASSSGSDVTFAAGAGITLSRSTNELSITLNATGAWTGTFDGQEGTYYLSRTNHTGTTPVSGGGTGLAALGTAGQLLKVNTGATALEYFTPTYLTAEVDGSTTNEGSLTVGAGTGTTSIINSNTSGSTGVTLTAAGVLSISESGNVITLTATEVDGSISNEIQNLGYTAATGAVTITSGTGFTIPVMVGANGTVGGARGLVPDQAAADNVKFLRGDGTWQTITTGMTSFTWGDGTSTTTITNGETVQVRPGDGLAASLSGNDVYLSLASQGASSGQVLKWSGSAWVPGTDNTGGAGSTDLGFTGTSGTITLTSSSGADVNFAPGTAISFSQSGGTLTINSTALTSEVDGSISNEGSLTVGAGTGTTSIINSNTSGSTGVTLTAAGALSISESGNVITLTATEVDGSTTNEIQTLGFSGTTSPVTLDISGTASDVIFAAGANVTLTQSGGTLTIAASTGGGADLTFSGASSPVTLASSTGTDVTFAAGTGITFSQSTGTLTINSTGILSEVDGSISNEGSLTVAAGTGTTSIINSNTSGQTGVTLTAAGALSISESGNVITLTATEVDGSISNEGSLTVAAGTGTTSIINSNTSGQTGVTLTAAGILTISESGNTITLTGTEVDGSTTNEIQNLGFTASSGAMTISSGTGVNIGFGGLGTGSVYASGDLLHLYDVSGGDYEAVTLGAFADELLTFADLDDLGDVVITTPSTGQVLKFNGTNWTNQADDTGAGGSNLSFTNTVSPVTLNSSTGTDVTFTQGAGITLSASGTDMSITLNATGNWTGTFDGQEGTYYTTRTNHTGITPISGGGTGLSVLGTAGQLIKVNPGATALEYFTPSYLTAEVDGSTTNEIQTLAWSGTVSPFTLDISGTATDVIFAAGANVTLTKSGTTLTIAASTGSGADLTFSGPASPVTLASSTGSDVTFTAGSGISFSQSANNITITNSSLNTDAQNLGYTASSGAMTISGGTGVNIGFGSLSYSGVYASDDEIHYYDVSGGDYEAISLILLGPVLGNYTTLQNLSNVPDGTPGPNQILKWNGTTWVFADDNSGSGTTDLTWSGSGPYTLNSSTGTDVTFTAGSGITLTQSTNNLTISASGAATNIYNTNGTLTAARTLTMGGYDLTFEAGSSDIRLFSSGYMEVGTSTDYTYLTTTQVGQIDGGDHFIFIGNHSYGYGLYAQDDSPTTKQGYINFNNGAWEIYADDSYGGTADLLINENGTITINDYASGTPTYIATLTSNAVSRLSAGPHVELTSTALNVVPSAVTAQTGSTGGNYTWDVANAASKILNLNLSGVTTYTINALSNPKTGGVYTFHLRSPTALTLTWNSIFNDLAGTDLGAKSYTTSTLVTCYYDGSAYYCR